MHRHLLAVAVAAAASCLTAGCGDSDGPVTLLGFSDAGAGGAGEDVDPGADPGVAPDPGAAADADAASDADTETPGPEPDVAAAGLAVGSACLLDGECSGANPWCMLEYRPLAGLVTPTGNPEADAIFEDIGLDFPGGYCGNQPNCDSDAACGVGGTCFRPMADVSETTLAELQALGLPFDVSAFADVGLCLLACDDSASCRPGWVCEIPMEPLLAQVPGSGTDTFCVHPGADTGLPTGAACGTDAECGGPDPTCLDEFKPLVGLVEPTGNPEADAIWESIGLDFPGGYCSRKSDCDDDDDCAGEGACFRPLADVSADTLGQLAALGLPFDINAFATIGVCLDACETAASCRDGYTCEIPIGEILAQVPGAPTDTYCVGAPVDPGLPVGSACSADSECGGPSGQCMEAFKPLEGLVEPSDNPEADAIWEAIGLDFPGGYCGNAVNCVDDGDCGAGGACFRPLDGAGQAALDDLEALGLPFDIEVFSDLGLCLAPCATHAACREGYECGTPLAVILGLVEGVSTASFCVALDPNGGACAESPPPCANGGTCTNLGEGAFECECADGFKGSSCDTEINECDPFPGTGISPCQNGGTCTDLLADYSCECQPGFSGKSCEVAD